MKPKVESMVVKGDSHSLVKIFRLLVSVYEGHVVVLPYFFVLRASSYFHLDRLTHLQISSLSL